jgi:hypothetical protein
MRRPLVGIVVASTCCDYENHPEHGRPVLLALYQLAHLLQWKPFLYLVSPIGATRYVPQQDGGWARSAAVPSALAAHNTQKEFGDTKNGRLLLVHLGPEKEYIHPGLLPWVAAYGKGGQVLSSPPTPVLQVLPLVLTDRSRLLLASYCPVNVKDPKSDGAVVRRTWLRLMSDLDHRK